MLRVPTPMRSMASAGNGYMMVNGTLILWASADVLRFSWSLGLVADLTLA